MIFWQNASTCNVSLACPPYNFIFPTTLCTMNDHMNSTTRLDQKNINIKGKKRIIKNKSQIKTEKWFFMTILLVTIPVLNSLSNLEKEKKVRTIQ